MLLRVIILLCLCVSWSQCVSEYREVETEQGPVRGYRADSELVFSFYGIPYATAPTGDDRFKGPLPASSRVGVFEATERNIICPQRAIFSDTFLDLNRTVDCLRLNVFVPNSQETRLPVMVYIHGGGWQEGYSMIFSPVDLTAKGIISVNVNYRLGVHGFLCLGTEFAPGNAGYKDQVAALQWVKRNIAQFGGDPDNISLAGSSAGSIAVETHLVSTMSNGLFVKAVSESGSAMSNSLDIHPIQTADNFANQFGVYTNQNVTLLENFYKSLTDEQLNTNAWFRACLEINQTLNANAFLKENPIDIVTRGEYEKRPYLTGFTPMEGIDSLSNYESIKLTMEQNFAEVLPTNIEFDSEDNRIEVARTVKEFYFPTGEITYQGFVEYMSDIYFTYPQMVSARLHARNSVPVYLYLFNFNGTINLPSVSSLPVWGPGHVAQSLYIQDYDYTPMYDHMTQNDYLIQERLRAMYVNFFKYGEPIQSPTELLTTTWLPVTTEADNYLNIDVELQLSHSPLADRFALWDQVYGYSTTDGSTSLYISICTLVLALVVLLVTQNRIE